MGESRNRRGHISTVDGTNATAQHGTQDAVTDVI